MKDLTPLQNIYYRWRVNTAELLQAPYSISDQIDLRKEIESLPDSYFQEKLASEGLI